MEFSSKDFRRVGSAKRLSFLVSGLSLDNVTGVGTIGFSGTWEGESRKIEFNFESGKVIDPEDRYVYSYLPNESINLSGNIYDEDYNYYINGVPLCFIGVKEKNIIDNIYVHVDNCIINTEIYINIDEPSYTFTQGDSFSKQGTYNINLKNNNISTPFDVFSGSFLNEKFIITNLPLEITTNENIIISAHTDLLTGDYDETLSLSTSVGNITNEFSVTVEE